MSARLGMKDRDEQDRDEQDQNGMKRYEGIDAYGRVNEDDNIDRCETHWMYAISTYRCWCDQYLKMDVDEMTTNDGH